MQVLPLFYYPSTWLWIDDDKTLLDNMVSTFEDYNHIKPFYSPKECLDFLKNYQSPFSKYTFLKSLSSDETYGVLQHTPTDFDVTLLREMANDLHRHEEITAMVIDYQMPEMDGFTFVKEMNSLPIQKILLTGAAQSSDAIIGFNNHLIHRYVQKQEVDLFKKLVMYLQQATLDYFKKISLPLLLHLETENKLPLSDPIFIKHFERYCKENEIEEYYLIDKQGSYLCINKKKQKKCFVVHTEKSIDSWLSSYCSELSLLEIIALKENKKIPFFGIGKEAWQMDASEWRHYFYPAEIVKGRERYYWTTLDL
jgi:CheY-like chemotaxis protein